MNEGTNLLVFFLSSKRRGCKEIAGMIGGH